MLLLSKVALDETRNSSVIVIPATTPTPTMKQWYGIQSEMTSASAIQVGRSVIKHVIPLLL